MNPLQAVQALVEATPDALYISALGTATSALRAATDDGPHFYSSGSMGTSLISAIGVAEKRPEQRFVVILGDGETLMGANSLWSFAGIRPANLLAVVLADGHYTITGDQPLGVPDVFADVASALGLEAAVAGNPEEIGEQVRALTWPALLEIRYDDREWPGAPAFSDPPIVRWRFEQAVAAGAGA